MNNQFVGWTQAKVGCHWFRGPFTASTISCGPRRGYVLVKDRIRLAEFVTWAEVMRIVHEHEK